MRALSSGGAIVPHVRLTITLRILAGTSVSDVMMLFRVAKSTVYEIFYDTIFAISRVVAIPDVVQRRAGTGSYLMIRTLRRGAGPWPSWAGSPVLP